MKKLPMLIVGAVLAVGVATPVAVFKTRSGHPAPAPSPSPSAVVPPAVNPYQRAVDAAHQTGLRVWLETDLVKNWLAGPDQFRAAVFTLGRLAVRPGVVGIKIADEMGYHDGLDSVAKVRTFLRDSATALHAAAPGKLILIDLLVPELGCLPDHDPPLRWATICAVQQRGLYPQLALDKVDGYLGSHTVDVVDLSTDLLPDNTYYGWGVDVPTAQRTAWGEVHTRGWDRMVRLQARKALAHPGDYATSNADTEAALRTYVDIPRKEGAAAVDVWTWRQRYQGQIYRLLDPGLKHNVLWDALVSRRQQGARLFTHLSPSSLEEGLQADLAVLGQVFTDVFVAAGTG
ncbi:MAG: hypothetical protein E6G35_07565 [Actinobacteria bacterium]|nr:MAG: hypothetical protein E6G35_07565 [Actinomycetota bacterium]